MREPIRILLQTTNPERADDWHVGRFSLLLTLLQSQFDESGTPLFALTARDRLGVERDPVLSTLDSSDFHELWLFATDEGDGLPVVDCEAISRFHRRGSRLLITRVRKYPARLEDVKAYVRNLVRWLGPATRE